MPPSRRRSFLYEPRTGQLSLIDFGACQSYEPEFVDNYLRLVRACADGASQREAILHWSRELGFLTGKENRTMLDAHVRAAALVGEPFFARTQPYDFGNQVQPTPPGHTCPPLLIIPY